MTLQESGIGLGSSFVVAFGLAVAMSHIPFVERAVMPVAVVLNVTPVVSIAPGLAVAMGVTSMTPRYLVTGIIVFFPMLVNSLVGLRSADREALEYFASLNAVALRGTGAPSEYRRAFLSCSQRLASVFLCRSSALWWRSSPRQGPPTALALLSSWRTNSLSCPPVRGNSVPGAARPLFYLPRDPRRAKGALVEHAARCSEARLTATRLPAAWATDRREALVFPGVSRGQVVGERRVPLMRRSRGN